MEQTFLVTILAALIGALSSQAVGYLTHYSSEQRERLTRQCAFREKQLQELYAPILAHILELTTRWELLETLAERQNSMIEKMGAGNESFKLKQMEPVHRYNIDVHVQQNEMLEKIAGIARDKFHLAEPSTKAHIHSLFRCNENRKAVKFEFPIDATGDPIPTLDKPFPPKLVAFMEDIELSTIGSQRSCAMPSSVNYNLAILL